MRLHLGAVSLALLLQACASPVGVVPGMSRDAVAAVWGEPQASYDLPEGPQRLFYDRQRDGTQRLALDFDAQGRLLRSQEVLTLSSLSSVVQPPLRTQEVLQRLGPPTQQRVQMDGQDEQRKTVVWIYRWYDQGRYRLASIQFNVAGLAETVQLIDDPTDPRQDKYR
ncbi:MULTISPECIES: hypothetical protein [Giesbergeria]|uniref:Lipoprotein n=1 Tax=Giesbergeria sinuosa TaxID=80883 RepID=A0ABV9QG02_9BURK